jgi:hypothetical protein
MMRCPKWPETSDDPIAHHLRHEIIDDEGPDDGRVGRDEEEERRDPGQMRCGYDRVIEACFLMRAGGKQAACVAG